MAHGREGLVLDDHGGVEGAPGVGLKPAAGHFGEFGPVVVGVDGGVGHDQAFAVIVDEGEQGLFLLVVKLPVAGGVDEGDCVEPVEIVGFASGRAFGHPFHIGFDFGVPHLGLVAEVPEGGQGVGSGAVVVAARHADDEQMFAGDRRGSAAAARNRRGRSGSGSRGSLARRRLSLWGRLGLGHLDCRLGLGRYRLSVA